VTSSWLLIHISFLVVQRIFSFWAIFKKRGLNWQSENTSVCVQIHEGHANGLSELRLGFDPVAVRVRFAVYKVALGMFLLLVLWFSCHILLPMLQTDWFFFYRRYTISEFESIVRIPRSRVLDTLAVSHLVEKFPEFHATQGWPIAFIRTRNLAR
jgi:phage shock protein PspC (stress-responsive transcriptional regulator)